MADEQAKNDARTIENVLNNCGFSPAAVGMRLSGIHRYLQDQFFTLCLCFLARLAKAYKDGRYDARNATACEKAYKMFTEGLGEEALETQNNVLDMMQDGIC